MKKALLIIAIVLGSMNAFAQNLDKNEAKQIKAFLSAPAKEGTNAQALKVSDMNAIASIEGVTVENGHVTAIEWKDKKLGGELNLSNFSALTKVDVSRNELTGINVSNCGALVDFNAGRNKITNADFSGCANLQKVSVYKNRLSDITLDNTPLLNNLNVSNNLFVELNVSNNFNLKTLNCQGCHLESLNVSGCTALKNLYCGYNNSDRGGKIFKAEHG